MAVLKILAHILLFTAAFALFYLGLGVGLAWNPLLGTVILGVSVTTAVLNLAWILIPGFLRKDKTPTPPPDYPAP